MYDTVTKMESEQYLTLAE